MDNSTLIKIIQSNIHECEKWDFKQEWHDNKAKLAADIINFVNTPSHENHFLIFGVSDNQKIVGVEKDSNRRTKQQVVDFLYSLPFAQSGFPKVDLQTFKVENHEVDVLTIFNSNSVPFFLAKEYAYKGTYIKPGTVYSRVNDSNTPFNKSASDQRIELLWKKRFRLGVPIKTRLEYIIRTSRKSDWDSKFEEGNEVFLYNKDPDFKMVDTEDDIPRDSIMEFSYSQIDPKVYWHRLELYYRNNLIKEFLMVSLDGSRLSTIVPGETFFTFDYDYMVPVEYEIRQSLERAINQLIDSFDEYNYKEEAAVARENYFKDVIVVDSEQELKNILKELDPTNKKMKEKLFPKDYDYTEIQARIGRYIESDSTNIQMRAKRIYASQQLVKYLKNLQSW